MSKIDGMKSMITCAIHLDQLKDPILLRCQHVFCRSNRLLSNRRQL